MPDAFPAPVAPARRLGFRVARALLLAIASVAVFAPWIANDEPYLLIGIDRAAYAAAHRTLTPITRALVEATGTERARAIVAAEAPAARLRVTTLERFLAPSLRGPCLAYRAALDAFARAERIAASETAPAGEDEPGAAAAARELQAALAVLQDELAPERVAQASGFVSVVSSPLMRRLAPGELALALAWCALLFALSRKRWSLRRRTAVVGAGALLALTLTFAWTATLAQRPTLVTPGTKRALTEGAIEARLVVFPPLAMGYAETNLAESLRPPTWLRSGRMTTDGRYVDAVDDPRDEADGGAPVATPVEVRRAEPALNAPLRHPFGTDGAGRDLLARVVWGGRASLAVGFFSAVLLTAIGTLVGVLAGTLGGRADFALSRLVEVVIAFPAFFLVLVVMALADPAVVPPLVGLIAVIAVASWTGVARLVRAEFLRLREADFVLAARALGFSTARIVFGHMLPNALGPVLVAFAFAFAGGIFIESTVSFLGFGIERPTPSWGGLIAESSNPRTWWLQVFPGLAILVTVVCVYVLGEGLRAAYDPGEGALSDRERVA